MRFNTDLDRDFLDNNKTTSALPWSSICELQNAIANFENDYDNDDIKKWLSVLISPGSSVGGARPKAYVLNSDQSHLIATFQEYFHSNRFKRTIR